MKHPEDLVDHLFRHQYGRMVAILCKLFGTQHIETIEDAVQDTFSKAIIAWRNEIPDSPEAWLTRAAKNRTIDLFRKLKPQIHGDNVLENGAATISIHQVFLEEEVEDAQLRMIFTACHPVLDSRDQIAFALKSMAGFSQPEISSALLLNEETVKKRLSRARKAIASQEIRFDIPQGSELSQRLATVLEVIYLIFNEGFHSSQKDQLVRKELCTEALRLCTLLTENPTTALPSCFALLALMYFHSARLDGKMSPEGDVIGLEHQDRRKWNMNLADAGNDAMNKALESDSILSAYHYEAAIAAEHLKSRDFEHTDWMKIKLYYQALHKLSPSPLILLNLAIISIQLEDFESAEKFIEQVNPDHLKQRSYLYHGTRAEVCIAQAHYKEAEGQLEEAILLVGNDRERDYMEKKLMMIRSMSQ